jgi:hypothetical protein
VIDLDRNRITFGTLGPPPTLPPGRCKKLLVLISNSTPSFDKRGTDWAISRLPLFDSAFTAVTENPVTESDNGGNREGGGDASQSIVRTEFHKAIRAGFLNFFVSILKNYRRYILIFIYIYMYINIYICMYIYTCIYMYAFIYMHEYVCIHMYVCMYIFTYTHLDIYTCIHMYIYIGT